MKKDKFDFGGWATKNDLLCADGRTIRKNAFKDDDGRTVPLVYQHNHDDPTRVVGHALLKNMDDGVFAYCSLNGTDAGQHVKECVRHRDICSLSIYANKLTQRGGDVLHGTIREVSVVLAGANPGAMIVSPVLEHGEESQTEAFIWSGDEDIIFGDELNHSEEDSSEAEEPEAEEPKAVIAHAEEQKAPAAKEPEKPTEKTEEKPAKSEDDMTIQDVLDTFTPKQRKVLEFLIDRAMNGTDDEDDEEDMKDSKPVRHADDGEETVQDVVDSLNPTQKKVLEYLVAQAMEEANSDDEEDEDEEAASHSINDDEGEEYTMKKNVFDNEATFEQPDTLTHAQMDMLIKDGKRLGSLRASVLEHAAEYGIDQIDWLFPEDKNYTNPPGFVKRDQGWVSVVMNGVHHTPFTRVKTMFADITENEARARGYLKGKQKKTEVFKLLKRSTDPQTIYKKQKLDRDDVIDITDFDVVAWLKSEMRMMLDEEIARAILIGDGREGDSDDHISEDHIRSVFHDDPELYIVRKELVEVQDEALAKTFIKTVRRSWKDYKGSGNCIAFMTEDWCNELLLLEDRIGHFMYASKDVLANVLGVTRIITVPVMSDKSTLRIDTKANKAYKPACIILNLNDYNVGADKGGSVNMFEDFDIDYNAQKYLIETRCSGALVKPFSAIVIEEETDMPESDDEPTPNP